jgi:hypothetical protein
MSDPRTILERAARRIDPRSDAFERLERRRERKARNRRVTAGVVALVVAIGGSYAAFSVFRDSSGGTIGGAGDRGFHALWPEVTLAGAQSAQRQFLAGDPDLAWRVDAGEVAGQFAHESLGWDGYSLHAIDTQNASSSGPVEVLVQHVTPDQALASASPVPACDPAAAGGWCPATEQQDSVVVVLDRLVDPGGVWSVVEVYDPARSLRLPISPGATVVSGQEYLIPFQVPDGFQVEVGYTYIATGCGGGIYTNYSSSGNAAHLYEVGPDGIRFSVADMSFDQSCDIGSSASVGGGMDLPNGASLNVPLDGYVFIALQPSGADEDDPFDASLPNAIRNAPISVAAVPVHFVPVSQAPSPGATQPLPSVAQVSCSDTGTQVSTPIVQPQADGVHIVVDNSTGADLGLAMDNFGGDNAPTGVTEIVRQLPPGVHGLACVDPQSGLAHPSYETLEVQDPAGIWVSTDLTGCTSAAGISGSFAGASGNSSDIVGVQGTPVEVVTSTISGLLPADVIEPAGYPSTPGEANVRVVRDGNVVASYHLFPDDHGGWYIDSAQACDDTGLASLGSGGGVSGSTGPSGATGSGGGSVTASICPPRGGGTSPSADITIVARNISFDPTCLVVPAGEPLTIRLDNEDSGVQKNIAIYPMDGCLEDRFSTGDPLPTCRALAHPVFRGDISAILGGPTYQVPALDAGRYWFQDDVHPNSYGLLIVK